MVLLLEGRVENEVEKVEKVKEVEDVVLKRDDMEVNDR